MRNCFVSDRDGNNEIHVMIENGSNPIRLTNTSLGEGSPSWSPDGTKIVFCSGRDSNPEIYVMNTDGRGQMNLTNYGAFDFYPKWSPDGRKIVFASSRDDPNPSTCAERCKYEIYAMNADGSGQIRLANYSSSNPFPSWSP